MPSLGSQRDLALPMCPDARVVNESCVLSRQNLVMAFPSHSKAEASLCRGLGGRERERLLPLEGCACSPPGRSDIGFLRHLHRKQRGGRAAVQPRRTLSVLPFHRRRVHLFASLRSGAERGWRNICLLTALIRPLLFL